MAIRELLAAVAAVGGPLWWFSPAHEVKPDPITTASVSTTGQREFTVSNMQSRTVCLISRDLTIVVTVIIVNLAIGRRTFRPTLLGKIATGIYIATGFVFLVVNYLGRPSPVTDVMVYLSLIITVVSALHYIRHAGRIISEGA